MSSGPDHVLVLDKPCRACGLFAAAVVGWVLVAVTPFLVLFVGDPGSPISLFASASSSPSATREAILLFAGYSFVWLVLAAIFGLPLSVVVCCVVGYPAWLIASERGLTRWRHAVMIGAAVGFVLYVVWAMATFAASGAHALHHADVSTWVLQGLLFHLCASLYIAGVGAVAGLAAWWAGGEKSVVQREDTA